MESLPIFQPEHLEKYKRLFPKRLRKSDIENAVVYKLMMEVHNGPFEAASLPVMLGNVAMTAPDGLPVLSRRFNLLDPDFRPSFGATTFIWDDTVHFRPPLTIADPYTGHVDLGYILALEDDTGPTLDTHEVLGESIVAAPFMLEPWFSPAVEGADV